MFLTGSPFFRNRAHALLQDGQILRLFGGARFLYEKFQFDGHKRKVLGGAVMQFPGDPPAHFLLGLQ